MTFRRLLIASAFALVVGVANAAAQQTGEIYGRATDTSGAVLPGATVTVAGPALIQPRVAVTSETGTYRVPELPIGVYSVTVELAGFRTMALQDIRVTIGFRAQVNASLELSTVQETVTVSGASPLVDTREVGTKSSFDLETLQNIPSARDPWVMLERTPGIVMDRANVGGNQSGQQSSYISRGASTGNNKWSIDGVDITDMAATGASPIYYDFDMLEEMQVTTGGADVTQQTGGVGINLVTKSGTDRFKGSGRFLLTDQEFQGDNITDELRAQGAGAGAPIQNIRDYGFDIGGPIVKSKLWYWGSYGTQDVKVGVVGFYKNNSTCRPNGVAINPRTTDTETLRGCLETDLTTLNNYNWKVTYVPFRNNRFSFQNTWAEKVRNARDASDLRPIETAYRQKSVSSDYGAFGWLTGPNPFYKAADQHVINDRMLVDVMWSHLGNNFALALQDDALMDVQPAFETTTSAWSRSYNASIFTRPTNSLDVVSTYFAPATLGGDHSLKFGYRWRTAHSTSINHRGGFIEARFTNGVANSADIWRDQYSESHLATHAFYIQDTYTRNRLTLNLGLRYDRQDDFSVAGRVPENPHFPQLMPAIDFRGADAGVVWNDISPRVGATYDVQGNGRTVLSSSYAIYYGQMAPGGLSNNLASTAAVWVRYPWADANGDRFVQPNEVNTAVPFLAKHVNYDPANPASTASPTRVDPDIKNDRTREFIVGFDRQLGSQMAVGASYIWRKYDQFAWNDRDNFTSANYRAVSYTPAGCPAGARCEPVTYYEPNTQIPSANLYTNMVDRWRDFNGFEVTFGKRMSNRWSMNASYAYNNAVDVFDSPAAYEDPTCTATTLAGYLTAVCPGSQIFAPESAGSGIGNVFQNSKWLMKLNGRVQLPFAIDLAANYLGRQGFPFPQSVLSPNRANGAGQVQVHLDPLGENRYDALHTVDLRLSRGFSFGSVNVVPAIDVFNLTNTNTVQAMNRNQVAANANQVSGILPPRVARFGVSVRW
ncbi:MAG TPA: TonB-dependent receptor [Vicinamibacterales bacterium]|nr:TonB-dependent receptor [Vicinamibacterales bacterium]